MNLIQKVNPEISNVSVVSDLRGKIIELRKKRLGVVGFFHRLSLFLFHLVQWRESFKGGSIPKYLASRTCLNAWGYFIIRRLVFCWVLTQSWALLWRLLNMIITTSGLCKSETAVSATLNCDVISSATSMNRIMVRGRSRQISCLPLSVAPVRPS